MVAHSMFVYIHLICCDVLLFSQTSDDSSDSNNVLPSLLYTPVPCQKWMAGEKLCFIVAVMVDAVFEKQEECRVSLPNICWNDQQSILHFQLNIAKYPSNNLKYLTV